MTHMLGQAKHRLSELEQSGVDTEPVGEAIEALEAAVKLEDLRFAGPPPMYRGHIQPGHAPAYYGPDDVAVDGDWLADVEGRLAACEAVIAEVHRYADERAWYGARNRTVGSQRIASDLLAILDRVPQGAAEPSDPDFRAPDSNPIIFRAVCTTDHRPAGVGPGAVIVRGCSSAEEADKQSAWLVGPSHNIVIEEEPRG